MSKLPDPDSALNYLERYLRPDAETGESRAPFVRTVAYLKQHPAALHHLLVIFSYSRFLSETLVQQPELITWLHRPTRRVTVPATTLTPIKRPEICPKRLAPFAGDWTQNPREWVLPRSRVLDICPTPWRNVSGLS